MKEQVTTLTTQVEAANVVVRKLEEKERLLQNSLATVEKELALRQQAMEMHKRKAIESAQSAADLKLHLGNLNFKLFIYIYLSYPILPNNEFWKNFELHPYFHIKFSPYLEIFWKVSKVVPTSAKESHKLFN